MLDTNIVTGAYSYTGKYITRLLLDMGKTVKTLTGHPDHHDPFDGAVEAMPYNFDNPAALVDSLRGASILFNTYWVRFSHGGTTFEQAIQNSRTLFEAAKEAGVHRVVHVSIANPSPDSPFPYYAGKAAVEQILIDSGLSYAILRPTVIFSLEDVLINNIAWIVRRFPLFAVPGDGTYRLQPLYVEDMAKMAVDLAHREGNVVVDAIGPEIFTFNELVQLIAEKTGSRTRLLNVPPRLALLASQVIGLLVRDVVLTPDEVDSLLADLLATDSPPTSETRLTEWLDAHADQLGKHYASELNRHFRGDSRSNEQPHAD